PRPNVAPVAVQRALGQTEHRGGLVHRQAGEVAQEDDLGLEGVTPFQLRERLVDREYIVRGRLDDGAGLVQLLPAPVAAPPPPGGPRLAPPAAPRTPGSRPTGTTLALDEIGDAPIAQF